MPDAVVAVVGSAKVLDVDEEGVGLDAAERMALFGSKVGTADCILERRKNASGKGSTTGEGDVCPVRS